MTNSKRCPACGGEALPAGNANMNYCGVCGLVWLEDKSWVAPVYEPGRKKEIYAGGKLELFGRFLASLAARFPERGRLLDVGAASGVFMELAKADGWKTEGVEIDPGLAAEVAAKGFKVYTEPLEELKLPAGCYDAVTAFEVLSQMADPVKASEEIGRTLKAGGLVYIREFNGAFHMALHGRRIFELLGLRPAVVHNFNFTAESLRRMLAAAGFKRVKIRNSPPTSGDPYGTGGRLGSAFTGLLKVLYYYAAQAVYYASFGKLFAGSALIIEAEK